MNKRQVSRRTVEYVRADWSDVELLRYLRTLPNLQYFMGSITTTSASDVTMRKVEDVALDEYGELIPTTVAFEMACALDAIIEASRVQFDQLFPQFMASYYRNIGRPTVQA